MKQQHSLLEEITGVKCLHVNDVSLKTDYPEFAQLDQEELMHWFEDNFSLISPNQIRYGEKFLLPSPGVVKEKTKKGLRHAHAGRTCVISVELRDRTAQFEVKGCGVSDGMRPLMGLHRNGLMGLLPALREYFFSALVHAEILGRGIKDIRPANIYAILLYPFVCPIRKYYMNCALLVREALVREPTICMPALASPEWNTQVKAELLLRKFGITSCLSELFVLGKNVVTDISTGVLRRLEHRNVAINQEVTNFLSQLNISGSYEGLVCNIQMGKTIASNQRVIVDCEHFRLAYSTPALPIVFPANDRLFGFGADITPENYKPDGFSTLGENLFRKVQPRSEMAYECWSGHRLSEKRIFHLWDRVLSITGDPSPPKLGGFSFPIGELRSCLSDTFDSLRNL